MPIQQQVRVPFGCEAGSVDFLLVSFAFFMHQTMRGAQTIKLSIDYDRFNNKIKGRHFKAAAEELKYNSIIKLRAKIYLWPIWHWVVLRRD